MILHQQQHNRAKAGIISSTGSGGNITNASGLGAGTRSNVSEKSYSSLSTDRRTLEQDNDYYGIGKKHALKKYDQFALNTTYFWGSAGSNITPVMS